MVEPRALFEVTDRELDQGVAAMLGLDERQLFVAVGDEGVVAPVGKQGGLGADEAGAAHDESTSREAALGDPRDPLRMDIRRVLSEPEKPTLVAVTSDVISPPVRSK